MKELVVISGKGGTGKTSIVAAFASLAEKAVLEAKAFTEKEALDNKLIELIAADEAELFEKLNGRALQIGLGFLHGSGSFGFRRC